MIMDELLYRDTMLNGFLKHEFALGSVQQYAQNMEKSIH
jgi:hypothetical protein